jgi:hypothetical protein
VGFLEELRLQRWDDHRYYHHSRINQALHLFSACCFLTAYGLLLVSPATAAVIGWLLAMTSRQMGHFFFEPKGYDHVNDATHEHKEEIKVGYNLFRKVILMSLWAVSPLFLYLDPGFFGLLEPHRDAAGYIVNLGILWFALGILAIVFRVVQLYFKVNLQTGLVWATKILTDPFHDFWLYRKSPLYLLKGELYDQGLREEVLRHG